MAPHVTAYTLVTGATKTLELAQGEDREFQPSFTQGGVALDMTGATAAVMTIRNRVTGILMLARNYSGFQGAASLGTPRFQILQADTVSQSVGAYDVDIFWTDASGYEQQLQGVSTLNLLKAAHAASDPLTTPPAIPVVYGINWGTGVASGSSLWTGKSGGYQINEAVEAYDGSLGATAISTLRAVTAGVTLYPIDALQNVASGWRYIGQHGGMGPTGSIGATGIGAGSTSISYVPATGGAWSPDNGSPTLVSAALDKLAARPFWDPSWSLVDIFNGSFFTPASFGGPSSPYIYGNIFTFTRPCRIAGVRYYTNAGGGARTVPLSLYDTITGTLLATVNVTANTDGIYSGLFASPYVIDASNMHTQISVVHADPSGFTYYDDTPFISAVPQYIDYITHQPIHQIKSGPMTFYIGGVVNGGSGPPITPTNAALYPVEPIVYAT